LPIYNVSGFAKSSGWRGKQFGPQQPIIKKLSGMHADVQVLLKEKHD
jgi:hypothetical protein